MGFTGCKSCRIYYLVAGPGEEGAVSEALCALRNRGLIQECGLPNDMGCRRFFCIKHMHDDYLHVPSVPQIYRFHPLDTD